ncbi:MAG: hypothetical protein J6Z02_07290 [Lachnospiraceae bacterium]|nr:hypothetical protein [Lachnospiraceae bacterium]
MMTGRKLQVFTKRIICMVSVLAMVLISLAASPVTVHAASYTGMKLPSDKVLASYVKKYVVKEKSTYDGGKTYFDVYSMNTEALEALPLKERAKIAATMSNCSWGTLSSSKKKTSKYINELGRGFSSTNYDYIDVSEAPSFFAEYAKNLNVDNWDTMEDRLFRFTSQFYYYFQKKNDVYVKDYYLEKYDQVLDTITIIDGKIESGAKNCKLLTKETRYLKVNGRYGNHKVNVYLVTKPGTIKYKSVNAKNGKTKTYKKKYTSIETAIDKEVLKGSFTDKQIKNMITVTAANEELAGSLHEKLLKGESFTLKIDAPENEAKGILKDLHRLMRIKSGGYTFMCDVKTTISDTCVYVGVSKDYANVYKKSGEFVRRLETQYKAKAAARLAESGYWWSSDSFKNVDSSQLSYLANTSFADMSEAGKLFAIMYSGIFDCVWEHPNDGSLQMVYSYDHYDMGADTYAEALQKLMDGKASGVCQVYAMYEKLVFRMLGFECYSCSNGNINHAWTVVKVTNKAGKELWVPFDYGIGPSSGLMVSEEVREKYIATEEMRYALYLENVAEAPKYRNFTMEDFFE